mgnify:CR=1 FL=1
MLPMSNIIKTNLQTAHDADKGLYQIAAPTGSGKSHNVAELAKDKIEESIFNSIKKENHKTIIYTTDKKEGVLSLNNKIYRQYPLNKKALIAYNVEELFLQALEATKEKEIV